MNVLRLFRHHTSYAALVILTLALGIGANTAIFSVINGVLIRPLPYAHGDEVVLLQQPALKLGPADYGFSMKEVEAYRTQTPSLVGVDAYHSMSFTMLGRDDPIRVQTGVVSASFFDDLGVRPIIGRTFRQGEDAIGAPPMVVLSNQFWKDHFGGDARVLGQTFTMNDRLHTIVGVLPPLPAFPGADDIYIPLSGCPFNSAPSVTNDPAARTEAVVARLMPRATMPRLNADLRTTGTRLHADYPGIYPADLGLTVIPLGLRDVLTRDARPTLLAVLAMTVFLLVVSGANVANLTLARQLRRTREVAMRVALGADRRRLLRELIAESVTLALIGGVLGLIFAWAGLGLFREFAGRFTANTTGIRIDGGVMAFTFLMSIATGLVFGAMPALPARRSLSDLLRDGGATSPGASRGRLRGTLVVCQVAIAFVLLVGAGLLARTLINLRHVNPGYDASRATTALVSFNWSKYPDTTAVQHIAENLVQALRAQPGVTAVGVARALPLDGQPAGRVPLEVGAGRPVQGEILVVGGDYFSAIGTPVLSGRAFVDADRNQQVVVVSEAAAREFWRGQALGARISADGGKHWYSVVGVVGDVRQHDLTSEIAPVVYVPFARSPATDLRLLVRANASVTAATAEIRETVSRLDPMTSVSQVQTLAMLRKSTLASPQLTTVLSLGLALVALLISGAGLGGVMAFAVAERTKELGIRLALGARRGAVLVMVVRQGMMLVGIGLAAGLVVAVGVTRGLRGLLFGVGPLDMVTYAAVLTGIVSVTFVACLLPARRAVGIDPLRALRSN